MPGSAPLGVTDGDDSLHDTHGGATPTLVIARPKAVAIHPLDRVTGEWIAALRSR